MAVPRLRWALAGVALATFLGIGAVLPVLADDVTGRLGRSDVAQGAALAVFGAAALTGRLPGGWLADHRGRRTAMAVGAGAGLAAGGLYALSPSFPLLLAARALHGTADAIIYTSVAAWAVDITPPDRRTEMLGFLASGVWGGFALGPLVGAALGRLDAVGLVVVATSAVGLVGAVALPRPRPVAASPGPGGKGSPPGRRGRPRRALSRLWAGEALLPGLAVGLVNVGYATVTGFVVVHLERRGGHGAMVLGAFALTVLVARLFVLPVLRRVSRRPTLAVALATMAAGLLALALGPPLAVSMVAAVAVGAGFSVPWPVLAGGLMDVVPEHRRAAALATMLVCVDLFVAGASVGAGLVAEQAGSSWSFVLAAGAVGCAWAPAGPALRRQADAATLAGGAVLPPRSRRSSPTLPA